MLRNGQPLMTNAHAEKYIAFRSCQATADRQRPLPMLSAELKGWKALARELGLDRLQRLIGKAQRWRLLAETGTSVDAAEMDELLTLAGSAVSPLPTTLV